MAGADKLGSSGARLVVAGQIVGRARGNAYCVCREVSGAVFFFWGQAGRRGWNKENVPVQGRAERGRPGGWRLFRCEAGRLVVIYSLVVVPSRSTQHTLVGGWVARGETSAAHGHLRRSAERAGYMTGGEVRVVRRRSLQSLGAPEKIE